MTKRLRLSVAVGILAVATVVVYLGIDRERILEAWYVRQLESREKATVSRAQEALVEMCSARAVPIFLEAAFQQPDEEATPGFHCAREILSCLEHDGLGRLANFLDEGDPQVFMKALLLHKTVQEETTRRASLLGFVLKSRNSGLRRFAAEELTHLGPEARSAISALKKARSDSSEDVRFWVNIALRNLGDVQTHDDLGSME